MAPEVGAIALPGYVGELEVCSVRSEVFSLGATLYWMLAGTPPVTGTKYGDAATAIPANLWDLAPHITPGTRNITMKAISRDSAERYADPAALGSRAIRATGAGTV